MSANALDWFDEKQNIQRCFATASRSYDSASRLQRVTGRRLFEVGKSLFNGNILDLGCGTGANSQLLCSMPGGKVFGCDLAPDMALKSQQTTQGQMLTVQGDGTQLPFADESFDAVYSNLMLQWIDQLDVPLAEIKRVLKPGGSLCFTTLLDGTLCELKTAWASIDSDQHVNNFKPLEQLQSALNNSGFTFEIELAEVVLDYLNVTHLARELKHLGANYVKNRVSKGLTGRNKWLQLSQNYPNDGRGGVPATYNVAYVVAGVNK